MRFPLPFDVELISVEETLENINWYLEKVEEANNLSEKNDKKTAMLMLREINDRLKVEYNHYNKVSVRKRVKQENKQMFMDYSTEIRNAYVKQNKKTTYDYLPHNLYDVSSYLGYYKILVESKYDK
ncbi:hypothetical protein [Ignavigranum ruoffiae]|uniref:hypothetical protein n=1 Tax=Ignavigranum ruoffiae TaxID=89093 RepID=UPI002355681C|nr:hypothetical protein [Ignavigranum ruoffiae]